ncbi:hypothetical protein M9Y10_026271 [Tritrichomonas musculus]|uniref:Myb-like DNA-binding domain containing protein n=1 Tax=Tritrichomonas musculus TaxID=1915356 RepID=A0ABR2GK37_9EUKA
MQPTPRPTNKAGFYIYQNNPALYNNVTQCIYPYSSPYGANPLPINAFGYNPQQSLQFKILKQGITIKPRKVKITKPKKEKSNKSPNDKNARKKFTPEEDEKLKNLVENTEFKKWDAIAKEMPGRTGRQCRDRYKNYLVPGFFNGQWSKEEDNLLRLKYAEFGPHWSKITAFFKNRSANALKNRWNYFVSKHIEFEIQPTVNVINVYEDKNVPNNNVESEEFFYEDLIDSAYLNPLIDIPLDLYDSNLMNEKEDINCNDDFLLI